MNAFDHIMARKSTGSEKDATANLGFEAKLWLGVNVPRTWPE